MKTCITNGTILTPEKRIENATIIVENGRITRISSHIPAAGDDLILIDAGGLYVCPGFIDVHFHGAVGQDAMDADAQALVGLSKYCAEHGVTSFYPTTWSASPDDVIQAIVAVKEAQPLMRGAQALGVHIEGPYIDMKFRGAQLPGMIRLPEKKEYEKWFGAGVVKLITCAPELEGCSEFIRSATLHNIRISIGHSQASYEEVINAADMGANQATHIFNGMSGLHHREPGTVGGVLDDGRIFAQIICDGTHLHPAVVRLVVRAKSFSRVILITDSIRGAGLPNGKYDHKGQRFSITDGVARTPEGGLSGSTLTLDAAVRNVVEFTGCTLEEGISMATKVPAEAMGISDEKGRIAEGCQADLVLLNQELCVEKTIVNGEIVFERE